MAVEIRNLTKRYGDLTVFEGLDLDISEASVTALLGPSGCGKTTLLEIIAGAMSADGGTIAGLEHERISYVFQDGRLLPWKTVFGNVEFVLRDRFEASGRRERTERWLGLVGLARFAGYYPHQLSGGMQQRVGIARAFAAPSSLLLLDEPFQALDPGLKQGLIGLFEEVWNIDRRTTLFVTHDIGESLLLADRLFVLSAPPTRVSAHFHLDVPHGERSLGDEKLVELERRLYALLAK